MSTSEIYQNLLTSINSVVGMLELSSDSQLKKDIHTVSNYLNNPVFQIAVFGPFNYGKSTLLNALLGNKTLPIDLIPTTGAAIHVRYGESLSVSIALDDGNVITQEGTKILKEYAILDDQRCMRQDVTRVDVYCPHPFLKHGVELLDLPGTNDRVAQDNLVKDRLLSANLIVQVLDARKLMTLGERENLKDWLLDRGIKTVIFVVNFMNLLEPEEQKEVQKRMVFVAQSFRSDLPESVSNLYRVDALPALRAILKGDSQAAQTTGLSAFEAALSRIVAAQSNDLAVSFSRVLSIVNRVKEGAKIQIDILNAEIKLEQQKQQSKLDIQEKAEKLIKQGFQKSISDFQEWLYLPAILSRYQSEMSIALQSNNFEFWEYDRLRKTVSDYQEKIHEWVKKACDFFEKEYPGDLIISFPDNPEMLVWESLKTNPQSNNSKNNSKDNSKSNPNFASVAIPAGIGLMFGGPMGAAVLGGASYYLRKKKAEKEQELESASNANYYSNLQVCNQVAEEYLTRFSNLAFVTLQQYQYLAEKVITFEAEKQQLLTTNSDNQLQLLQGLLKNIDDELDSLNIKLNQ